MFFEPFACSRLPGILLVNKINLILSIHPD